MGDNGWDEQLIRELDCGQPQFKMDRVKLKSAEDGNSLLLSVKEGGHTMHICQYVIILVTSFMNRVL